MMRKLSLLCSAVSAIVLIVLVATILPDTVATHYDLYGNADAWGSKWFYGFFALLPLIIHLCYEIYRRKTAPEKRGAEEKIILLIPFLFIAITWIVFPYEPQASSINPARLCWLITVIGLAMMYISNYLGKLPRNPHTGIKTPWTLKNETVWKKTHRMGGFLGMAGGAVMTVCSIIAMFQPLSAFIWCMVGLFAGITLTAFIPMIYSAVLYHRLKKEEK